YITGMDTRIGYPNEHLAGDSDPEVTSPLYATAVGLVLNSLEQQDKNREESNTHQTSEDRNKNKMTGEDVEDEVLAEHSDNTEEEKSEPHTIETVHKNEKNSRRNIFDKWFDRFKDFLDNAE